MTRNRPPYKRNKSRTTGRGRLGRKEGSGSSDNQQENGGAVVKNKLFGRLKGLLILVVIFSVVDFVNSGSIRWPQQLIGKISEQLGGPDASWRDATARVEELGRAKEGSPVPTFDITGRVVRVADGDTVSVLDANKKQHKIRLYGIDTPERDQPHGKQSRRALADMVADEQVGVVIVETDSYGRAVGTLYHNDIHVNAAMVRSGNAWWYRYYAPHSRLLSEAEKSAREESLGLWAQADPIPPWDWRRNQRRQ